MIDKHATSFVLNCSQWNRLGGVVNDLEQRETLTIATWNKKVAESGMEDILPVLTGISFPASLAKVFSGSVELRRVSEELHRGVILDFRVLAERIFPGDTETDRTSALAVVIRIGMIARATQEGFPLLPARYHLAVNCPDGMSVKLDGTYSEGWGKLHPLRRYQDGPIPYYSLLVCRKCGQPFIEGFDHAGMLLPRQPILTSGRAHRKIFWLGQPPGVLANDEADSVEADRQDEVEEPNQ